MLITCYNPDIHAIDGEFVRRLRDYLGWTQARFAKVHGISTVLVSMIETNQKEVSKKMLQKMADKLKIHIEVKFTPEY